MQSSAKRMQVLINDLLTYSRVSSQGQPFSKVDLNSIVKEVLSDLEIRIEQTSAEIKVDPLPPIDADPSQMRQLFQNLLANALKFHKPGEAPKIQLQSKVSGTHCVIQISDEGIGFDEKYLDRIFTIFQRLHGRHEYEGTGVGLAVCRRIIERHHGTITANSTPGKGSTFILNLPLHQEQGD